MENKKFDLEITTLQVGETWLRNKIEGILKSNEKYASLGYLLEHVKDTPERGNSWLRNDPDYSYCPALSTWRIQIDYSVLFPGHELLAHVDLKDGISTSFGDYELDTDTYKKAEDGHCDHCHTAHHRVKVYVIRDKATGVITVVGGSCAKKYGITELNIDSLVSKLDYFIQAIRTAVSEDDEYGWGGGGSGDYTSVGSVLYYAGAEIARAGYQKRDEYGRGTGATVLEALVGRGEQGEKIRKELAAVVTGNPAAVPTVEQCLEAVRDDRSKHDSEFLRNIETTLTKGFVRLRHVGRLAYAPAIYQRWAARLNPAIKTVAYQGASKKHDLPGVWTIVNTKTVDSDFGSYKAFTCVNDKNEKVWFKIGLESATTNVSDFGIGQKITIKGKVKATKEEITFLGYVGIKKVAENT